MTHDHTADPKPYRWTGLRFCAFWIAAIAGCIGVWWLLIDMLGLI